MMHAFYYTRNILATKFKVKTTVSDSYSVYKNVDMKNATGDKLHISGHNVVPHNSLQPGKTVLP